MKSSIEVSSRAEGDSIRLGLEHAATRALVTVIGALQALPDDKSRTRVLQFVSEVLGDGQAK